MSVGVLACGNSVHRVMNDEAQQKRIYLLLAIVFGVAGAVWIVYGFFSPRFILYPLIGLVNLGIAYVCRRLSA